MGIIYDSADIRVIHLAGNGPRAWVTYTSVGADTPFGLDYVRSRGEPGCFVMAKRPHFYQTEDIFAAVDAVDAILPRENRVSYGSSAGGFAAVAFAKRLGIDHAIVAAPLVSVHPDIVGSFDRRWDGFSSKIDYVFADARNGFHGRRTLLYDPAHSLERQHAKLMAPARSIHIPFSGHGIMYTLREAGILSSLITAVVDDLPIDAILAEYTRCRRKLNHTRLARAEHLESRRRWKAAGHLYQRAAPASPAFAWFRSSICLSQWGDKPGAADAADMAAHFEPGYAEHAKALRMAI